MTESLVLDEQQSSLLELPDGECARVLGAAGTGKTTLVIEYIASRVAAGAAPATLGAVAGTRQAATRLREQIGAKLHQVAPDAVTPGAMARTLPSLAFSIVAARQLGQGRERPVLLTASEQDRALADLLAGHLEDGTGPVWPDHLGDDVRAQQGFRTELRDFISRMQEHGRTPAHLRAAAAGADIPASQAAAWRATADLWAEYLDVLQLETRDPLAVLDASRLLFAAAEIVRAEGALPRSERALGLHTLLIDDAAELTDGACHFVAALAEAGTGVMLLGDPDTATGMFRGANPAAMSALQLPKGSSWHEIVLRNDYRHAKRVANSVRSVTGTIGAALAGTHRDTEVVSEAEGSVESVAAATAADEAAMIARSLRLRHLTDGVPWGDMAIVCRTASQAQHLTRWLGSLEVPTSLRGAQTLRSSPTAKALMQLLGIVTCLERLDARAANALVASPLVGLDALGARRLRRALRHAAIDAGGPTVSGAELLAAALADPENFVELPGREARAARKLAKALAAGRASVQAGATAEAVLYDMWHAFGVSDAWRKQALDDGPASQEAHRRLDAAVALLKQAARYAEQHPDADAAAFAGRWSAAGVDDDNLAATSLADVVAIGTPSAFVSAEFDTVIVAGVQDGIWPNLRLRGSLIDGRSLYTGPETTAEVLHDERRLFASALSRARAKVLITAQANADERPSVFWQVGDPRQSHDTGAASLKELVGQLRRELVHDETSSERRHAAAAALARLKAHGVRGADPASWSGLDAPSSTAGITHDAQLPVSPSAIEQFGQCPLDWAIARLQGPTNALAASVGTIVHEAVETAATPTADAIMQRVRERWGELTFAASWDSLRQLRIVEEMAGVLEAYFAQTAAEGYTIAPTDHEVPVSVELDNEAVLLRGKIDWIERKGDKVRIVDLKTGATAPSKEATREHPQLRAYQLAVAAGKLADRLEGAVIESARLLYPKATTPRRDQAPLTPDELAEFRELVVHTAHGMAGAVFHAAPLAHCQDARGFNDCKIHSIEQVTQ